MSDQNLRPRGTSEIIDAAFALYRREMESCPRWAKTVLASLRAAVVLLLAGIFLGPAVVYLQNRKVEPTIVVLRDASQSMNSGFGSFSHWPVCGFFRLRPTANRNLAIRVPLFVAPSVGLSVSRPINITLFSVAMCDLHSDPPP